MADWANPQLSSTYTNFLAEVKNRDVDLALQFDGTTSTNLTAGTIRWSSSANRWQKWSGSVWGELATTYALTGLSTTGNAAIGGTLTVTGATALTGGGTSTTAATDNNTTNIATTAFVVGQASATAPVVNGTATIGTSLRYARQDHVHPTDTTRAPLASPSFTGTASFAGDVNLTGTGSLDLPAGTTAQRPSSPNSGMIRYNSELSQFEGYGSAWGAIGGSSSGVNALINGNPIINQRNYISGTATSGANQYTLDRWRVVTAGQSIAWSDSGNIRTVTAPSDGVTQVVEGINIISGVYVLSWVGTANAQVGGAYISNGGTVYIVGGVDTPVRFYNGTFALAQLERGSVATPFECRNYSTELELCQRYFYTVSNFSQTWTWYGDTAGRGTPIYHNFPVNMRTSPTTTTAFSGGVNASGSGTIVTTTRLCYAFMGCAAAGGAQITLTLGTFTAEL